LTGLRPTKVAHLIPRDGIGGVESAARSMLEGHSLDCDFYLVSIAGKLLGGGVKENKHAENFSENNPAAHIRSLGRLITLNPDILVCSLWRAIPTGLFYKLIRPKVKLVMFLHYPKTTHWLDQMFSKVAVHFCDAVWADSHATLIARVGEKKSLKKRVISFVTTRNPTLFTGNDFVPHFVFWGRVHRQKGIDRSLHFIKLLNEKGCSAHYEIWGPDGGALETIKSQISRSGLEKSVSIKGSVEPSELSHVAHRNLFYLQLSRDEGMAMSVVEAMQKSLVPIVTPVGEIKSYCQNGKNAIVVKDADNPINAVNDVIKLLDNEPEYRKLQSAAYNCWREQKLYRDDFCEAAKELQGTS